MKFLRDWWVTIFVVAILISIIPLAYYENTWKKQAIHNWAAEHSITVVELERAGIFERGPYYYCGKGQTIYRGKLKGKSHDIWFRTSLWSVEALNSRGEEVIKF